ncbi:MAG TPA: hypothetical protein VHD87_16880 [Acidimicrobiales bacterium]|nr:hypothetical protein [Acidimicrobiales bacterium]
MTDLFTLLDRDWQTWSRRPAAQHAMARWHNAAPNLRSFTSVDELMAVFEDRSARDEHDDVLLALLAAARSDADARRAVVQILRAGLVALAVRARKWSDWAEASSAVVAAALDRIGRYPEHRTARVAANLLGDIWHSVWAERQIELRHRAGWTHRVDVEAIDTIGESDEAGRGEELMTLIDEAVHRRRITPRDARIVVLHRVLGYTNVEVGRIEGQRPCTIRKRRLAAEAAITKLAVA